MAAAELVLHCATCFALAYAEDRNRPNEDPTGLTSQAEQPLSSDQVYLQPNRQTNAGRLADLPVHLQNQENCQDEDGARSSQLLHGANSFAKLLPD